MIRLFKSKEPDVLVQNAANWTAVLKTHEVNGTKPTDTEKSRYNHSDIKSALRVETAGKCAYCESKFEHIAYGDIEHIVPKKLGADFAFRWDNLTLACDICNTNKGVREDIVDPYHTNPESRFFFSGPIILPRPDDSDAILTEHYLELNRAKLVERRSERIKRLHDALTLAIGHKDPRVREAILIDLETNEVKPDQEFAATARAYIKAVKDQMLI